MRKIKRIFALVLFLAFCLTVTSCSKKSTRNTVVPYGDLNLDAVIAESADKDIKLTNKDLYTRLRAEGYSIFLNEIKKAAYSNELAAIEALINSSSIDELSNDELKNLSFKPDTAITADEYTELKADYKEAISNSILSSIFSSNSTYTVNSMTDKEVKIAISKYIESMARDGYTITAENIKYSDSDNDDTLELNLALIPSDIINKLLLSHAENLYAQKELFKIAGLEYITNDEGEEEKNNFYYFDEEDLENIYDSTYKTYGTYKAIIITYNSRRDALNSLAKLGTDITADSYLTLYNNYYSCYGTQTIDSEKFEYVVSEDENELNEISNSVNTLITETLEDGEFLTEPRNVAGKYVLAYRISTEYDYNDVDYKDLDAQVKESVTEKIKTDIIKGNANSYVNTCFNEYIENADLEIYDPFFEYRFRNSYTNQYDLIEASNSNVGGNLIFKLNDYEYTVENFYNTALKENANSLIPEYFQLEYALKYQDEFLEDETIDNNKKTLSNAIKDFKANKNTACPSEIGLETFLLHSYGYTTEENVLKYNLNGKSCLSAYKAKVVFDEWATEDHKISQTAEKILNNILEIGNETYKELFNMDVDHILINIDYDANGTPDDPAKFLTKLSADKQDLFKAEVERLIKAIYTEATYEAYEDNKIIDTLTYIVSQFNKGADLLSNPSDNWDNYKTNFNFMLTAEKLAANGDITQDSVSNFVKPFADYLKEMYKKADGTESLKLDDNGNFFINTVGKLDEASDVDKLTFESLCPTVFGYHLIVLNEFDGPNSLKFTENNDTNGYQSKIQVLLSEDKDNEENNVYVELSSYNDSADGKTANLNQLFIYYVQLKNGVSSSLDSNIETILASIFKGAIDTYCSDNFQTLLLLDELNISSTNADVAKYINTERDYYANLVISYDEESKYVDWIDPEMDWARPNQK